MMTDVSRRMIAIRGSCGASRPRNARQALTGFVRRRPRPPSRAPGGHEVSRPQRRASELRAVCCAVHHATGHRRHTRSFPTRIGPRRAAPRGTRRNFSPPDETSDPRSGARLRTAPRGRRRMRIGEAAAGLRARRFSAVDLATAAISRIDRLNPTMRAFITVTAEQALEQARQADRELAMGQDRGPFHGVPVALKDLFYTKGVPTTAGSKVYQNFLPEYNATVVEKLLAAGAVLLGKLNMHEFAYGITSANPHFAAVRNPWNPRHSPGGSSGGSAAAVATHMVFMAMGTDTGGSI